MRKICQLAEQGDDRASIALEVFCYRLAKHIASLSINLDKLDALIFTGGIGENAAIVRQKTIDHLALFSFKINHQLNQQNGNAIGRIDDTTKGPCILVIPTNEELMIARQTQQIIEEGM